MSIFSPKKGRNITIIRKEGEKIVMSVGAFLGKFYFSTGFTLKIYQKSNFSPKNNLFSTFLRKCFTKKKTKNHKFWIKHILT